MLHSKKINKLVGIPKKVASHVLFSLFGFSWNDPLNEINLKAINDNEEISHTKIIRLVTDRSISLNGHQGLQFS